MVVYKFNEIPSELLVDHQYTLRQIRLFLITNKGCTFLHKDVNYLDGESQKKVTITAKDEYYIHQQTDRAYLNPSEKRVVYFLSQVEEMERT
jgi:hypothetical protein